MSARSDYTAVSRGCARQEATLRPACACPRAAGQSATNWELRTTEMYFSSGGWKSKIKVLAGLYPLKGAREGSVPAEALSQLLALGEQPPSSHYFLPVCVSVSVSEFPFFL